MDKLYDTLLEGYRSGKSTEDLVDEITSAMVKAKSKLNEEEAAKKKDRAKEFVNQCDESLCASFESGDWALENIGDVTVCLLYTRNSKLTYDQLKAAYDTAIRSFKLEETTCGMNPWEALNYLWKDIWGANKSKENGEKYKTATCGADRKTTDSDRINEFLKKKGW